MIGLAVTLTVAAAYEAWALVSGGETISEGLWRIWRHPAGRAAITASLAGLVAHVLDDPARRPAS